VPPPLRTLESQDGLRTDSQLLTKIESTMPVSSDPARTLLVTTDRPHPWALLRDLLDPAMVRVSWLRPTDDFSQLVPWALAGEGTTLPRSLRQPGLTWWVGTSPPQLSGVLSCAHWQDVAARVKSSLAVEVGGVRLAPICGLLLPHGRYARVAPELESLLAAYPGGVPLDLIPSPLIRRMRLLLRRRSLPLDLIEEGPILRAQASREAANAGPA
jgi:hypothetical protein